MADQPNFDADDDAPAQTDQDTTLSPLYGGRASGMHALPPESLWERAKNAITDALTPDPDRAAAKAAGIGLYPTGGELLQGVGMIAAPMAAPGVVAAGGRAVASLGGAGNIASRTISGVQGAKRGYKTAGPIGAVAGGVIGAVNPVSTGTIEGAITGAETGGLPGAVGGALLGAIGGGGADKVAKVAKLLKTAEGVTTAAKVVKTATPAAAAVKSVVVPITDAETLIARVKELKDVQKLSGAQIAAALKQWHGIPMKEATQAVKMVLGAN